jgi:hypothetical protein
VPAVTRHREGRRQGGLSYGRLATGTRSTRWPIWRAVARLGPRQERSVVQALRLPHALLEDDADREGLGAQVPGRRAEAPVELSAEPPGVGARPGAGPRSPRPLARPVLKGRRVLVTAHPAAAMRFPWLRRRFLRDLHALRRLAQRP